MPTPAQKLTKAARDLFHAHGWVTFKCAAGMVQNKSGRMVVFGTVGAPDFVAIKGQRYVCCEVKAGGDRLSPNQVAFQESVERVFGNYLIVRCVGDVLTWIQGE